LQTIEYIPNSLQEEWTEAWNAVHMLRQAAVSEEEKERAMKSILWLPQGLLHAPQIKGRKQWKHAVHGASEEIREVEATKYASDCEGLENGRGVSKEANV
jgi:hypothetical protein